MVLRITHRCVSSMFNFLQHASVGRVKKLESENKALNVKFETLETLAKGAMTKGETALNCADEDKKLVKK